MWYHSQHCVVFVLVLGVDLIFLVGVAVHKATTGLEMAMDVAKHIDLPLFLDHLYELPDSEECRVQVGRWIPPLTVHVVSSQVCSMVPVDNSIRIQHGHNVKDILFS